MFRFAIGVDETAFTRATAAKPTVFATGVVDLHSGKLIDMIEGRRRKVLLDWPSNLPSGQGGSACRPSCHTRCGCRTCCMSCG